MDNNPADNIKEKSLNGFVWGFLERFSTQITQFVLGIVLARILLPKDFGIYGLLTVFIAVGQTFIESGFSNALIRKLNRKNVDLSTAFYSNIGISLVVYSILFLSAPYISLFFYQEILTSLLRLLSICLVIDSFTIVPIANLSISLNFKRLAIITFISAIVSGLIGIILALNNFGVWSLAYKHIFDRLCIAILIWATSKWKPSLEFSYKSFKDLFGFGSKLLASGLLNTLYLHLSTLVVGKFYSATTLGYYSRGEQFASLPGQNISAVMKKVTYPILSIYQNDNEKLVSIYRKYISYSSLIIFYVLLNIASLAKPIVQIVLTEKWNEAIVFLQLFIFAYMFNHISDINLNLLQVKGRSDLYLKLEIIKKTISFIFLIVAIPFGALWIAVSRVVYTQFALFINTYYTGKLFGLGYVTQLKDFSPFLLSSLLSCMPSYILVTCNINNVIGTLLGFSISIIIYVLLLRRNSFFLELMAEVKQYVKRK